MVPVFRDILADTDTPVSAFMKIDNGGDAFLLESVEGGEKWGRYSFLGVGPRMVVRGSGKTVEVIEGGKKRLLEGDPIDIIQDLLKGYRPASVEGEPRFSGGAIGYMGYDIVRHIERLPDISPRELSLPDIYLILTDTFLVFDNVEHRIKIVSNAYINDGDDPGEVYARSIAKIEAVVVQLRKNTPQKNENEELSRRMAAKLDDFTITSNFKRDDFLKAVERIKEYIVEGDIFQAVISQRFSAPLNADPFDIYRALRVINPSPYMFYLKLGEATLVGSSPEILVRVEGESVNVKPIAGTRKR
ncbi:MAG TPA: chorismate-binding protein, partial [Thermodesulfobacteriota bacterium]